MIKLLVPLPKKITIACSGGVDSMAIVDFLKRKHDVTIAYFHHGTEHGEEAFKFVATYCTENGLPMMFGKCRSERDNKESQEEFLQVREKFNHTFDPYLFFSLVYFQINKS